MEFETYDKIITKWVFGMYAITDKKAIQPWHSISRKPIESAYTHFRQHGKHKLPDCLKKFMELNFKKINIHWNGDDADLEQYWLIYTAMSYYWCCSLCDKVAMDVWRERVKMEDRDVMASIFQSFYGNENTLTEADIRNIVRQSVANRQATPDQSFEDSNRMPEPTPKTRQLNEMNGKIVRLLADLRTRSDNQNDIELELEEVKKQFENERVQLENKIRRLQRELQALHNESHEFPQQTTEPSKVNDLEKEVESQKDLVVGLRQTIESLEIEKREQSQEIDELRSQLAKRTAPNVDQSVMATVLMKDCSTSHSSTGHEKATSTEIMAPELPDLNTEFLQVERDELKETVKRLQAEIDHLKPKTGKSRQSLLVQVETLIESEKFLKVEIANKKDDYNNLLRECEYKRTKYKESIEALEWSRNLYLQRYAQEKSENQTEAMIAENAELTKKYDELLVEFRSKILKYEESITGLEESRLLYIQRLNEEKSKNHTATVTVQNARRLQTPQAHTPIVEDDVDNSDDNVVDLTNDNVVDLTNDNVVDLTNDTLDENAIDADNNGDEGDDLGDAVPDSDDDDDNDDNDQDDTVLPGKIPNEKFTVLIHFKDDRLVDENGYEYRKNDPPCRNGQRWRCVRNVQDKCRARLYTRRGQPHGYMTRRDEKQHNHRPTSSDV